jgi:hypothetical protein
VLGLLRDCDRDDWVHEALHRLDDARLSTAELTATVNQLVEAVTVSRWGLSKLSCPLAG